MVIDYVICLFIITYIEDVLYTLICIGGYSCLLCALSWISCSINYIDELFFFFLLFFYQHAHEGRADDTCRNGNHGDANQADDAAQ